MEVPVFDNLADGLLMSGVQAWQSTGNCLDKDPDLFFPERGASTRAAKAICNACEVRVECLEFALENRISFGIWGGKSGRERRLMLRSRREVSQRSSPDLTIL